MARRRSGEASGGSSSAGPGRASAVVPSSGRYSRARAARDAAGVAHRAGVHRPDGLEAPASVRQRLLSRSLDRRQAGRQVRGVADHDPLPVEGCVVREGHLDRQPGRRVARGAEPGEHHGDLGGARELDPPRVGGAEERVALEPAEEDRPLRPGAALVLDRVAEREQAALGQRLRHELGLPAAQLGVERAGVQRRGPGTPHRRLQREPRVAVAQHLEDGGDVLLGVPPVPAGQPDRSREVVARLPAAQRRRGDAGAIGEVADGEQTGAGRRVHDRSSAACLDISQQSCLG